MKNLRTTVGDGVFDALESAAVAEGKTLASYVRRVLDSHVVALISASEASSARPSTEERLDRQARAIKSLRADRDALLARVIHIEERMQ